ncbi:MAG: serine hydrolase [Elusimicrobiota bacterium]
MNKIVYRKKRKGFLWQSVALGGVFFVASAGIMATIHKFFRAHKMSSINAPAQTLSNPRWQQLVSELDYHALRFPGRISIYLKELNSGKEWTHNPDQLVPSASLIKIPLTAAVLKKIKDGGLSLDTPLILTKKNRMSGSGSLKWQKSGAKLTVMELLYHMITESDNTAMRMLVNQLGMDYFQKTFSDLGLLVTNINEEGLRLSSRAVPQENYTSAREMAELLESAYKGTLVSKPSSQILLELMKNLKHRERLAKTLPPGWGIAHKTGLLRRACHDAGIIYSPAGDYILVVMTWKGPDYRTTKRYISKIGKITYRYFNGESDFAATASGSYNHGI